MRGHRHRRRRRTVHPGRPDEGRSSVWLRYQFTAFGQVRLLGARIAGDLDLTSALIESSVGSAVNLDEAVITGSVYAIAHPDLRRPVIHGRLDMRSARIEGRFVMKDITLGDPATTPVDSFYARPQIQGTALSAPRLSVGADVTMEGSSRINGGVDLSRSELSNLYIGSGCSLHAAGRTALDLTNADLLSTFTLGRGVPVEGTIRLSGTRIHGNLRLQGANLSDPDGDSLIAAQGLQLDGEAELENLKATGGELEFRSATIGSALSAAAHNCITRMVTHSTWYKRISKAQSV